MCVAWHVEDPEAVMHGWRCMEYGKSGTRRNLAQAFQGASSLV